MLTSSALKMRNYRAKYPEKLRAYDNDYYHRVRSEKNRVKIFEGKICRCCEILLSDEYGAHGKKYYCDSCVDRGHARRHGVREATKRWRERHRIFNKIVKSYE